MDVFVGNTNIHYGLCEERENELKQAAQNQSDDELPKKALVSQKITE
jgi:hypothetical protein